MAELSAKNKLLNILAKQRQAPKWLNWRLHERKNEFAIIFRALTLLLPAIYVMFFKSQSVLSYFVWQLASGGGLLFDYWAFKEASNWIVFLLLPITIFVNALVIMPRMGQRSWKQRIVQLTIDLLACLLLFIMLGGFDLVHALELNMQFRTIYLFIILAALIAAFLDLGFAAGFWIIYFFLIPPAFSSFYFPDSFNNGLAIVWNPFSLVGFLTVPLFIYVRQIAGSKADPKAQKSFPRGSLVITISLIIGIAAIMEASIEAVVRLNSRQAVNQSIYEHRFKTLLSIRANIERQFGKEAPDDSNKQFVNSLRDQSIISYQNLYLFDRNSKLVLAALNEREPFSAMAYNASVDPYKGRLVLTDLDQLAKDEAATIKRFSKKSGYEFPSADKDWLLLDGMPATVKIFNDYLLLSTSSLNNWWKEMPSGLFRYKASIYLYWGLFGALFIVFSALLGITRLQQKKYLAIQQLSHIQERARISQEAHDKISNRLSALAMQAELESRNLAKTSSFYNKLSDTLRRTVFDLKAIVADDLTGQVSGETLSKKVKEICSLRQKDYGFMINTSIDLPYSFSIDSKYYQVITSSLEEALGNVAKHAKATEVSVQSRYLDASMLRLEVRDNGIGFDVPENLDSLVEQGHLGLSGINRRVKELAGEFKIQSTFGRGTALNMVIPLLKTMEGK